MGVDQLLSALSDEHFHDGVSVTIESDEIIPLVRESAERERRIKEKIERIGRRL